MRLDLLSLRQFKCFDAADVPLAQLTLLSGFNAGGKSTALQSLLLLSQGLRVSPASHFLPLNGPMVRLGAAGDVVRRGARATIRFSVTGFGEVLTWEFAAASGEKQLPDHYDFEDVAERQRLVVESVSSAAAQLFAAERPRLSPPDGVATDLRNALRNVIFLGASRHNLLDVFPSPDVADPIYADVGHEGQYAPWWYVRSADNPVDPARQHPHDKSVTIRAQVDAWLNHLFPGAAANAESVPRTGMARLLFRMGRTGDWTRPDNIGYGLSYAFPLIVALLNAKVGQILVVDSPEAHLHPRAQSRMGEMLAAFAVAGVQIFVETHSDHILSGARLAVRRGTIAPADVAIHFFSGQIDEQQNGIVSPIIHHDGRLSDWPEGFFDQSELDLALLAGL